MESIEFELLPVTTDEERRLYGLFSGTIGAGKRDFEQFVADNLAGKLGWTEGPWDEKQFGPLVVSWMIYPGGPVPGREPFRPLILVSWEGRPGTPSHREPLKPPAGFEQFSMVPYVYEGAPKHPPDYLRRPVVYEASVQATSPKPTKEGLSENAPHDTVAPPQKSKDIHPSPPAEESPPTSGPRQFWIWAGIAAFFIAIAGVIYRRIRQPREY